MNLKDETILIVDDEVVNIEIVSLALEDKYTLIKANNAEEALDILKTTIPAIILLDIMMPGLNGYELCQLIRSDERLKLCKVILLSGKAMLEERLKGYHAGANEYIPKPFEEEELQAKVKVFIELYRAEKKLELLNLSLESEIQVRTEQLFKTEKMAFLGMHAAEIVHNLRNPLVIILAYAGKIKFSNPKSEDYAKKIKKAGERLGAIITSILDGATVNSSAEPEDVGLHSIITSELEQLQLDDMFRYKIKTILEFSNIPLIMGVPNHFSQIFGNIIKNSIESMYQSEKKELRIRTNDYEKYFSIHITDTGSGVSSKDMSNIFNPFFTTKPKESIAGEPTGTGLGLASCKRMVESYGGTLSIKSKLGEGTTLTVRFKKTNSETIKNVA